MILICGLPNSGKTTYSQRFDNVLHLDDFPRSKFLNCNKAVAEADGDIVVEGIYNTKCRRNLLLQSAKGRKVCIWIDTPYEVCLDRCQTEEQKRIVNIAMDMFQEPTLDEGWDEIIIVKPCTTTLT